MDEQRHVNLLEAYLDNRLTPNERRELEQLLRESATMRRLFWVYVQQHAFTWELLAEARGKNLALTESGVRSRESLVGGAGLSSGSSGAGG
ncbi:MAG: hypothetical protein ACREJ2_14040, partial [Planctomycetota bacterium]